MSAGGLVVPVGGRHRDLRLGRLMGTAVKVIDRT
jgi:hypothetical protein